MAFPLCLTIGQDNTTVSNGRRHLEFALRLSEKGEQKVSPDPSRWQSPAPIRYPDPDIVVLDPRFRHLVLQLAAIERIATGFRFTEGPAWYGDGRYLLFSDIPNDALLRWDEITGAVATLRNPAGYPDGNTRDRQGRLITCELGSRTLTRTEHDGTVTVLATALPGHAAHRPQRRRGQVRRLDLVQRQWRGHPRQLSRRQGAEGDATTASIASTPRAAQLTIAVGDMERPNGLAFSPDEKKLYVVDTPDGTKTTRVYDIAGDKAVNGKLFFDGNAGLRRRHPRRHRRQRLVRLLRWRGS